MMDQRQTGTSQDKSPAEVFSEITSRHFAGQEISREDCLRALKPFLNGEVPLSETKGGHSDVIIGDAAKFLTHADLTMIRDLALARLVEDLRDNNGENDEFFSEIARAAARHLPEKQELRLPEIVASEQRQAIDDSEQLEAFAEAAHAAEMRGQELSEDLCLQVLTPFLVEGLVFSPGSYGDPYSVIKGAAKSLPTKTLIMIRDLALARLADDLRDGEGEYAQFFTQMIKAATYYLKNPLGATPDSEQDEGLSQLRGPQV